MAGLPAGSISSGLLTAGRRSEGADVLNGIAYDSARRPPLRDRKALAEAV